MTVSKTVVALIAVTALVTAAYGGYRLGDKREVAPETTSHQASGTLAAEAANERTVLYWHDPMYPQQKFDKPGKSPYMDMDLVPVYADDKSDGSAVRIDPVLTQSLGMRTALAEVGTFSRQVDTVGTVQADERRISVLQSRAAGWLEKLHLRAVNDPVHRGMPVAEIYAPELLAAQEEYLLLRDQPQVGAGLLAAARQRLSLLGVSEAQIAALDQTRQAQRRVVLHAPSPGIVTEIGAREGAAVAPGMPLASIVDLSRVWIVAQVPETRLQWISVGQPADATLSALPGEKYEGKVEYIYPDIDTDTRTVKVRFSVRNPQARLRPGMVASVTIRGGPKHEVLLVPDEAVIRTGTRNVVIVQESEGRYRAQEVRLGLLSASRAEIVEGLSAGDRVVSSGQFLIDSEASLRGSIGRLMPVAASGDGHAGHAMSGDALSGDTQLAQAASDGHAAEGVVKQVDVTNGKVIISHGPVATLKWPPMTMGFSVADGKILQKLKAGQKIDFVFVETDDGYRVISVTIKGGGASR